MRINNFSPAHQVSKGFFFSWRGGELAFPTFIIIKGLFLLEFYCPPWILTLVVCMLPFELSAEIIKLHWTFVLLFQYQLRLKTIAYEFLHGKKPNLQLGEKWIGDELGNRKLNPRAQEFINSVGMHDIIVIMCFNDQKSRLMFIIIMLWSLTYSSTLAPACPPPPLNPLAPC